MPAERLQVVAEAFEAWSRDDYTSAVALFSEDAEWYPHITAIEKQVYRGREEVEALFREISERLELQMDFSRMEPLGDCVVVDVQARSTGAGNDASDAEWFQLYSFRGDEICRVQAFDEREAAIEAAGAV